MPSFADPGAATGVFLNERSFDIQRRYADVQLDLFPSRRLTPYLAYTHDGGSGTGITPFETDGNEYPVATRYRDRTDNYRGGVRIDFNRAHVTLEQVGTTFKDDQRVFNSARAFGDRLTPIFDQRLFLSSLNQAYGMRGDSLYTKAMMTAGVWRGNFYAQLLYSRPST